jgi:hypothetical protein
LPLLVQNHIKRRDAQEDFDFSSAAATCCFVVQLLIHCIYGQMHGHWYKIYRFTKNSVPKIGTKYMQDE